MRRRLIKKILKKAGLPLPEECHCLYCRRRIRNQELAKRGYCNHCGYHLKLAPLVETLAQEIAQDIDRQVIMDLLRVPPELLRETEYRTATEIRMRTGE